MTLEPTESPEARKTGHRWVDLFVAFSALFISALSIFMGQQTGNSMEKLVHANSWPFLQLNSGNATEDGGTGQLAFGVENSGTGPARVHDFYFLVDGERVRGANYLYSLLRTCCEEELQAATARAGGNQLDAVGTEITSTVSSRFLATGEDVTAIRWPRTEANAALWNMVDQARQTGRITMRACYCSVFDECWIASSDSFPPAAVDRCEAPEAQSPAPAPAN